MTDKKPAGPFLFLPARAAQAMVRSAEEMAEAPIKIPFGINCMDYDIKPMIRGDLVVIMARPGHGKTTMAIHIAKSTSRTLSGEKWDKARPIVVYATWEMLVEEFAASYMGINIKTDKPDIIQIKKSAAAMIKENIAVVGRSSSVSTTGTPTLTDLDYSLDYLKENGYYVALVIIDYLQRIKRQGYNDRRDSVSENVEHTKDMALTHKTVMIDLVQTGRDVDSRSGVQWPILSDAQWSSAIEQSADKVIGLTKPSNYLDLGAEIEMPDGTVYMVMNNTLCSVILKQRWALAGQKNIMQIDFDTAIIGDQKTVEAVF